MKQKDISSVLNLPFPKGICIGVCAGETWALIKYNSNLSKFLKPGKKELKGESLLDLFSKRISPKHLELLEKSKPDELLPFTIKGVDFVFRWSELNNLQSQKNLELAKDRKPIRAFILHESANSKRPKLYTFHLDDNLKTILNSVHDGIWIIDANGITVYVNKAMKRIAGLDVEDMVGKHVTYAQKKGLFTSCITLEALEQGKVITSFDDYASGTRCLNTSTPFYDEDGQAICVVASIRDMSELESLQTKLAEAEQSANLYKDQLKNQSNSESRSIICSSSNMRACLKLLEKAAKVSSSVLILGETGTGKTLASSYMHEKSSRATGPFITVNCAAIPPTLIESELFGYEKGAFTGADTAGKKGFFQLADKGTLFLDEIGELPLNMQAKLLHVLDDFSFHQVGGTKKIKVDVRIITATNKPLEELVKEGRFREDLFYRLRVLTVTIPPLRERLEDIAPLAYHFLEEACKRYGINKFFEPKIIDFFNMYSWPGNVRELQATVEFLAVMAEGNIVKVHDLPSRFADFSIDNNESMQDLKSAVDQLEFKMIRNALIRAGSSYKAAELLGISQSTVVRKSQKLSIDITKIT